MKILGRKTRFTMINFRNGAPESGKCAGRNEKVDEYEAAQSDEQMEEYAAVDG